MTRRTDNDTAEKVKLALLTRAAFGLDACVHVAMHYKVPIALLSDILSREKWQVREDVQGVADGVARRRQQRCIASESENGEPMQDL
jgi:hypothetical protein